MLLLFCVVINLIEGQGPQEPLSEIYKRYIANLNMLRKIIEWRPLEEILRSPNLWQKIGKRLIISQFFFVVAVGATAEDSQAGHVTKAAAKMYKYYAEIYDYSYNEPDVMNKSSTVPFVGVGLQNIGQVGWDGLIYGAQFSYGRTDYISSGTGTIDGAPTYVFSAEGNWLKPYGEYGFFTGLGYRHLFDDGGGVQSSTGAWGYDRTSQYFYLPVGIIKYLTGSGYFRAQYNHLIYGQQTSDLGYLSDTDYDIRHDQKSGYGLLLEYSSNKKQALFLRYWKIEDSEIVNYTGSVGCSRRPFKFLLNQSCSILEPLNDTLEFGLKVLF